MKQTSGKPILIGIAFLLPLFFIAVVFVTSTIPSVRLTTDFDFVYATCSGGNTPYNYNCGNYLNILFVVENRALKVKPVPPDLDSDRDTIPDVDENYRTRLFFHDTDLNESREITLTEAQDFSLSGLATSPDGVSVELENSRHVGFFLFFDTRSTSEYFLTKGNVQQELNVISNNERYYYGDDFLFLGWVTNE